MRRTNAKPIVCGEIMAPLFANNEEPEIVGFCVNLLCKSIQRFYQKDAQFLFGSKIVDERALVGCVYRYMWCALEPLGRIFDIDIEYDRITDDEVGSDEESRHVNRVKRIESSAADQCCQKKCEKLNECADCLISKINEKIVGKDFLGLRPDIIVHRRGESGCANNAMWIEFKKKGGDYSDALFDQAKVLFNSCNKHEGLLYQVGAMVMLRDKFAHIGFFSNGQLLCGWIVDAQGSNPMSKQEEGQNLWCRPELDKEQEKNMTSKDRRIGGNE